MKSRPSTRRETVSDPESPLGVQVMATTLRQVRRAYEDLNWALFHSKLRAPVLEWAFTERELGAWVKGTRTLRLSARLLTRSWSELIEVLKHEMAHQYVDEVLHVVDETAHGASFRETCRARGIDARSAAPEESGLPNADELRILERIEKLLALASSDNQNEAETAMATARRLMLKYNIEQRPPAAAYGFRHLGAPTGRRMAWQRSLANLIAEFFFVEIIIIPVYRPLEGKMGSVVEACGSKTNLDVAEYAYVFLERAAQHLWQEHKRRSQIQSNADKQSYLLGVMTGFREKLARENQKAHKEGLVWVRNPELEDYFRRRHPRVRQIVGAAVRPKDSFFAGHAAGERLVLHRGIEHGAASGSPRLLRS